MKAITRTLISIVLVTSVLFSLWLSSVMAQQEPIVAPLVRAGASPAADQIITMFGQAETRVRQALTQYTFKRDVVLQTIGRNGRVTGEYIRNSEFLFDDRGNRIECVTYHPPSTIREMRITREDIQDLAGAQLLGIDIPEVGKYSLMYAGQEELGARKVYIIDVIPKVTPNAHRMSERFFSGRVWIDRETFQIVRIKGKAEPQGKQRFPIFDTWRTHITPELQLPTRTEADDVLHFPNRDVNYRIRVRYYDYKLFASRLKVVEIDNTGN